VQLPTDVINLASVKIKLHVDVVNLSFVFVDKKSLSLIVKLLTTNILLTIGMNSPTGNNKLLSHVLKLFTITIITIV
jgi:hypothetical protein